MRTVSTLLVASLVLAACGHPPAASDASTGSTEASAPKRDGAPVTVTVGTGAEGEANAITFANVGSKETSLICYSAPFDEQGDPRLFSWCDEVKLAPGKSTQVTACSTCSTEIPQLATVTLDSVKFADGSRWWRRGDAGAAANGAPLAVRSAGRRDWDMTQTGGPKPLYEVQNVSKKAIADYAYRCKKADGSESGGSVTPNDPIEPGEIAYFADADRDCHVHEVDFADGSTWAEKE